MYTDVNDKLFIKQKRQLTHTKLRLTPDYRRTPQATAYTTTATDGRSNNKRICDIGTTQAYVDAALSTTNIANT